MCIATETLEKGPAHYSQMGQFLYYPILESGGIPISQARAQRLVEYAKVRAQELGLSRLLKGWDVSVGTIDGRIAVDSRSYYVTWTNPEKTSISLVGILVRRGRPILDHGVEIQTD